MRDDQHLRVRQFRAQDVLDCRISRMVEIRRALVHDEERRRLQLKQTPSERKQLPLSLTCEKKRAVGARGESCQQHSE